MKHRYALSTLALLLALAGCAKNEPPGKTTESIVATINGKPISTELFEAYATAAARRPLKELNPEQRGQLLDSLIAMTLAAEAAEKNGTATAKKSEIEAQQSLTRMNLLSESVLKKHLDDHPITDAEIKAEYDTQVSGIALEYHARHILVESRAVADDVVAQLNKGGDFGKLAQKHSIDPSGKSGGDLGWFNLKTMVPQFSAAVAGLEKGKYTPTPVQTQFGWHVIKLEETRSSAPPAFDDVKEQVKNLVQRKKAQAFIEELRKTAKIEKVAAVESKPIGLPAPAPASAASSDPTPAPVEKK